MSSQKIIKDDKCCSDIVNIANACIYLSYWLAHFMKLSSIIISKSNKPSYDSLRSFHSIILLNMLNKLIEKAISKRL